MLIEGEIFQGIFIVYHEVSFQRNELFGDNFQLLSDLLGRRNNRFSILHAPQAQLYERFHARDHGQHFGGRYFYVAIGGIPGKVEDARDHAIFASYIIEDHVGDDVLVFQNLLVDVSPREFVVVFVMREKMIHASSFLREIFPFGALQLHQALEGRFHGRIHLSVRVQLGEFRHSLQHAQRRIGLHQKEDRGATDFVALHRVQINLVQDRACQFRIRFG